MRLTPCLLVLACALAPVASWAVDADHDGIPARDELREKLLAKYDTNKDGKLDDGERVAAKADIKAHLAEREAEFKTKHPKLFAKLDENGDGRIERGEAKDADRREDRREDRRGDRRGDRR